MRSRPEVRSPVRVLNSVRAQLNYLLDLAEGRSDDRGRLAQIILGVQTAREIETIDEDLADKLLRSF